MEEHSKPKWCWTIVHQQQTTNNKRKQLWNNKRKCISIKWSTCEFWWWCRMGCQWFFHLQYAKYWNWDKFTCIPIRCVWINENNQYHFITNDDPGDMISKSYTTGRCWQIWYGSVCRWDNSIFLHTEFVWINTILCFYKCCYNCWRCFH